METNNDAGVGRPDATCSALAILKSCGLHGNFYDDIEEAAKGVRDIIRTLRQDLADPPHDIQCRVLEKLGVEGFAFHEPPTKKLVPITEKASTGNQNWTVSDACKGGAFLEKDGHLWIVSCVSYDGTVEATCVETIKPNERAGWTLHLPNETSGTTEPKR